MTLFYTLVGKPHFELKAAQCWIEKINHIFYNLKGGGGGGGVLPRKNLKTNKARDVISGHF